MVDQNQNKLFHTTALSTFFERHLDQIKTRIRTTSSQSLAENSIFGETLTRQSKCKPIQLDAASLFLTQLREGYVNVADGDVGNWVRCISFEAVLPFSGNAEYLHIRPDADNWILGNVDAEEHIIFLKLNVPVEKFLPEIIQEKIVDWLKKLSAQIDALNTKLVEFNEQLPHIIAEMLEKERTIFTQIRRTTEQIPYPVNAKFKIKT